MPSLKKVASVYGTTITQQDKYEVRVEAPPFHVWLDGMVHELVCFDVTDAKDRMAVGIERCGHFDGNYIFDSPIIPG